MKVEDSNALFISYNKVNKDLMHDIITRYMNNYTGSLTITRSRKDRGNNWKYSRDFSEEGLNVFVNNKIII